MKCGYPLLVNDINEIINQKEKIQKEFSLGNQAILPQKGKRKKKKKKSGRKKTKRKKEKKEEKIREKKKGELSSEKI